MVWIVAVAVAVVVGRGKEGLVVAVWQLLLMTKRRGVLIVVEGVSSDEVVGWMRFVVEAEGLVVVVLVLAPEAGIVVLRVRLLLLLMRLVVAAGGPCR